MTPVDKTYSIKMNDRDRSATLVSSSNISETPIYKLFVSQDKDACLPVFLCDERVGQAGPSPTKANESEFMALEDAPRERDWGGEASSSAAGSGTRGATQPPPPAGPGSVISIARGTRIQKKSAKR